jgi:alpha-1,6-mannosyltransferase
MRSLVMELSPDVLQLSSPYLPWLAVRDMPVPLRSYVYHSDPINAYAGPFAERWLPRPLAKGLLHAAWSWMRTVCHSCDMTVVAGDWLRAELLQRGISRVEAVPFGIDHRGFGRERRSSTLRAELLGDGADATDACLIGIVGRLAVEKRQRLLIDAAAMLARSRPVTLLVLGDGPERERLRARAAERGLCCRFWPFTHSREHYAEVLASLDLLLHGSLCETYGFVLVEALASGTPVVVPDQGGAAHVGDSDCSETYPSGASAERIAAAALRLLERPRDGVSASACAAAARHPSRAQHFEHLFELYREGLKLRRVD